VQGGKGLQGTLAQHSRKFYGVLNGIDDEAWNPATDSLLNHQYSADDLSGKEANKRMLRERLGLATQGDDARRPLVGCITRLVPQKGVHLIRHSIYRTLERGGQFILLGSSPIPHIQHEFEGIARQFENHPQIRLVLKYDEALSHSIYAASDIFVIPSIFEPCGLTQVTCSNPTSSNFWEILSS
jgi:starch synthase